MADLRLQVGKTYVTRSHMLVAIHSVEPPPGFSAGGYNTSALLGKIYIGSNDQRYYENGIQAFANQPHGKAAVWVEDPIVSLFVKTSDNADSSSSNSKSLELELGKKYKTKDGDIRTMVKPIGSHESLYKLGFRFEADNGHCYTHSGECVPSPEDRGTDIVEEIVNSTSQASDGIHLRVGGTYESQSGSIVTIVKYTCCEAFDVAFSLYLGSDENIYYNAGGRFLRRDEVNTTGALHRELTPAEAYKEKLKKDIYRIAAELGVEVEIIKPEEK